MSLLGVILIPSIIFVTLSLLGVCLVAYNIPSTTIIKWQIGIWLIFFIFTPIPSFLTAWMLLLSWPAIAVLKATGAFLTYLNDNGMKQLHGAIIGGSVVFFFMLTVIWGLEFRERYRGDFNRRSYGRSYGEQAWY